ncbi:aspartate/glutamate racemase family protein [Devriesea agamarum]|uniref:aspartate/glutamate racemase family protein n=1 Tax=Devriesea agamarum TaxID=472569 RepID=UPI00071CDED8|nr:amino acid racemase [Devriesea agamarum]
MRTIGIIGGMSWYSTIEYYRIINTIVAQELGGHYSAPILLESLDFKPVRACQVAEDWPGAEKILADSARRLEQAGAETVVIATNLMHRTAPAVQAAVTVPLLHICDAIAAVARRKEVTTVGVIGTKWVMGETFYTDRLAQHGITTLVPPACEHADIDRVVFDELTKGTVTDASRAYYIRMIEGLKERGAQAIVLGCTEIEHLITDECSPLPIIDSMHSHAEACADFVLGRWDGNPH